MKHCRRCRKHRAPIIHEKMDFVQFLGGIKVLEFEIRLRSVQDVQHFVALATNRPYDVTIRDARNKINAKSFMEMFCLDLRQQLLVCVVCSDEEFASYCQDISKFLVK